jgi:hypothetical protein
MGLSLQTKNALIDAFIGRRQNFGNGSLYIGLTTTENLEEDGSNLVEPLATDGYTRVLLGYYGQSMTQIMSASVDGASANTAQILFPRATADWGTIYNVVFFTAKEGGTYLGYAKLENAKAVNKDTVANFDIGAIRIAIMDELEVSGN